VGLDVILDRTQLDARHHTNSELGAGSYCGVDSGQRVVVRERDRVKANALGFANDVRRRT
jgi:hypothetical protein